MSGIILSGPGELKSRLQKSPFLSRLVAKAVLCVVETDYGGEFGFKQTVKKCADVMKRHEFENEDALVEEAMKLMASDGEAKIVAIGFDEVLSAIEQRLAKRVILSAGKFEFAIRAIGKNGKRKAVKFAKNEIEKREKMKAMLAAAASEESKEGELAIECESFVAFFSRLCDEGNVELKLIGNHSQVTHEFAKGLGGCVAILHYAVKIDEMGEGESEYESDGSSDAN